MRWEELPMASRARLMAAAVRNGYTDIRSIKEAYANYQDLKLTTGNRYDEGGEFEVVNLLDNAPIEYDTEDTGYTPWFIQNTEHAPDNPVTDSNLFGKGSQMNQAKQQSVGGLRGFFNLLDKYKIPYIATSEFRPGAVTKSGNASRHSRKDKWGYSMAVDAVPKDGDFENFMQTIYSYPEIVDYMRTHKIGALEEFTPEVKRKTGARGKNGGNHVHFSSGDGADNGESWAIQMRDNRLKHLNLDTHHPMQDVTWADVQARKQLFELTPEEETLLNTSALGTYNPEYVDRNDPNYRNALADAVALDESLDAPTNNWAKWNAFLSMQSGQSDPISSYSAIQQKEEPSLYQLFAPQGDDYMYHGLNFAAYGGKVNKFDDGGFSDLPEQRAYRRTVNLKAPYTNYEDAVDMDDSIMLRLKKFFDKGVSNCTLTASQLFNPNNPIGRARTIVNDSINNGFYEIDADHVIPGTMVIASHPEMSDYNPEQNYHTMIVTGFAPNDYEYTFRDGTKYRIKKGEPLVSYSRGKASADNYVHDVPLSVYNANSEGKTYNRYYRPIDENYPQVMVPEITITR